MAETKTRSKKKTETAKKPSLMDEALIAQENIKRLKGELAEWEGKKDALLTQILALEPVFEQSKMQKAKDSKSDTYKEGGVALVRKATEKRVLDMERVRKTFPDIVRDRGTLSLSVADKLLGEETVAKYASTSTSYSYEVRKIGVPG